MLYVRSLPVVFISTFRRDQRTSHGRFVILDLGSARTVRANIHKWSCVAVFCSRVKTADGVRNWTHILECERSRQFNVLTVNVSELSQWSAKSLLTVSYSQGINKMIVFDKTNNNLISFPVLVSLVSESKWWNITEGFEDKVLIGRLKRAHNESRKLITRITINYIRES
jgi:uncharacterized protein YlbG (UPF0298 family)